MQLPRTREWREAAGLTQRELSKESGVGKGTIVRIENGESATPRTAKKIADTLNISVADLLESPPVPLGQAPTSSASDEEAQESEERREELQNIRQALLEAHNLFDELAGTYKASGDKERLGALRSAVALSSLGAAQLVEEDVDVDRDYELGAQDVVAELNRLGSLSEVLEAEEEAEEEAEGGVVVLADFKAKQRRIIAAS